MCIAVWLLNCCVISNHMVEVTVVSHSWFNVGGCRLRSQKTPASAREARRGNWMCLVWAGNLRLANLRCQVAASFRQFFAENITWFFLEGQEHRDLVFQQSFYIAMGNFSECQHLWSLDKFLVAGSNAFCLDVLYTWTCESAFLANQKNCDLQKSRGGEETYHFDPNAPTWIVRARIN